MPATPASPQPEQLAQVEELLAHFEQLEDQFQAVREGLTHSHRLATLGTVASIIAHEYNNILTPVISYAHLALAKPGDAALMKKALEKSLAGAERAAKISSSLLGFAREADQQHAAPLRKTIDEAVGCLAREPRKDGIELLIDVPDVQVAISPLNLQQVLLNLLLNAKKAMRRTGGILRITARAEGSLVHITVSDTGPGIPREIFARLFEPFATHRIDSPAPGSSAPESPALKSEIRNQKSEILPPASDTHIAESAERKGTGLGLCICRDLIRNAGGTITADTPGKFSEGTSRGATFHITLPKADDLFEAP